MACRPPATGLNRRSFVQAATTAFATVVAARPGAVRAADGLQKLTLVVGTSPPDPACHFLYYGRDNGFYKEAGIDIDIKGITSATNATRAVVAGEADIGWVDGVSSLQARAGGARIQAISSFSPHLDYKIVANKDIGTAKELGGKRFAVATIGGGTYIIPRLIIARAGADPDRVQWVALGNSAARVQALIAGTVDATITTTSFIPRLLTYPRFHVIADAGKDLPDMAYAWEIVGEKALQQKRAELQRFVAATARTVQWAVANPDGAVALSVALLPDAPKEEIAAGIRSYIAGGFWSSNGILPKEMVDFTVAVLRTAGQLDRPISYDEFVAQGFAKS
jgi:NitT/TauT family transport system substrate-binding protein